VSRLVLIVSALSVALWASSFSGASGTTNSAAAPGTFTKIYFPKADSRVMEEMPTTNFGGLPKLRVLGGAPPDVESYLRFNLVGIPGPVQSANLSLHTSNSSGDGTLNGPAIYGTAPFWTETGLTWGNRPGHGTPPLDDKGFIGVNKWVSYNVKKRVTGNGAYSFALASTSQDEVVFHSKEAPSLRPRLVVTYLDGEPPSPPPTLRAWAPNPTSVTLSWSAATDNVGVTGYRIYRDGALLATVNTGTIYRDTTAAAGSTYAYAVRAIDAAGNVSTPKTISVTTPVQRTYLPQADARVMEEKPLTNFGSLAKLRVTGGGSPDMESYLRFQVAGVSGPIQSATLWLRTSSLSYAGTVDGPAVYPTSNTWSETAITWTNRPARSGPSVADKAAIAVDRWVSYDVKSLVRGNGTFSFTLASTSGDGAVFNAREAASLKPMLVVRYRPTERLVMAAGDIACDPSSSDFNGGQGTASSCAQLHTSQLMMAANPDAVLPLGDLQYSDGTLSQFTGSYHPSWGRLKAKTRPAIGNHEYKSGATGYFDYFNGVGNATGRAGERGKGYYSFDVGAWHLIALNSNCSEVGGCGPGSPQEQWLTRDLTAHPRACTLAYWHHPLFGSGRHEGDQDVHGLWAALYRAGADVVLSGHNHSYERFAPQDTAGALDTSYGIREFVVGTGGKDHTGFNTPQPNSEVRDNSSFGVLALTLKSGSYTWRFLPVPGATFTDSGSGTCHSAPPPAGP
jgi:acid phosphatase type 7